MKVAKFLPTTLYVLLSLGLIGCATSSHQAQRSSASVHQFGLIAKIRPEKVAEYRQLHNNLWPQVEQALAQHHIHNYSIYVKELEPGQPYLFGYFEYTGQDFERERMKIREHKSIQMWQEQAGGGYLERISAESQTLWVEMPKVFYTAGRSDMAVPESKVQHYGMAIGLRPELVDAYVYLHANTWPEVLNKIREGNIRNYSIYLANLQEKFYLLSHFEYVGDNFEADMAHINNDRATQAWHKFTDELCQVPLATRAPQEWWAAMEGIYAQ